MSAGTMPDLQGLWETAQREIALEGSSGCTLKRLWELVNLVDSSGGGSSSQESRESKGNREEEENGEAADPDPREFLKGWLWRYVWCLHSCGKLSKFHHAMTACLAGLSRHSIEGCMPSVSRHSCDTLLSVDQVKKCSSCLVLLQILH